MPIFFDEVSAEIAPPDAAAAADGARRAPAPAAAPDPVEQVRHALALLREREARAVAD